MEAIIEKYRNFKNQSRGLFKESHVFFFHFFTRHLMNTTRPKRKHHEFEKHLKNKNEEIKLNKKKKQAGNRVNFLNSFKRLKGKGLKMKNNTKKTEFILNRRKNTLAEIFFQIIDDDFLDILIASNTKKFNEGNLPPLLYKNENSRMISDVMEMKRRLVIKFFAQKIYIMGNPSPRLTENFPSKICDDPLGEKSFQKLNNSFLFRFDVIKGMNSKTRDVVSPGRVVVLDEKHVPCDQHAPHARWVKGKNQPWGHWVSEVSVLTHRGNLPYMMLQLPITHIGHNKVTNEPYNNYQPQDIVKLVSEKIDKDVILIMDAYYLDDKGRQALREKNQLYLCSINPIRFAEVWEKCQKYIKKVGDWVVLYSEELDEYAMMVWHADLGKKYILTNAFEQKETPDELNIIFEAYEFYFNTNDRFNHFLHGKYWPYRRVGWQTNYDNFFFSTLLMDIYSIWHEIHNFEENIPWSDFCNQLSLALIQNVQK